MRTHLLPGLLSSFVAFGPGCRAPTSDATDDGVVDATDTGTTPTTTTFDGFRPAAFGVRAAAFAIGADGSAIGYTPLGGSPRPITVEVVIGDETVSSRGFDAENSCTVTLAHQGPVAAASWDPSRGVWFGLQMPADALVTSDCAGLEFPESWGDPADRVAAFEWGVGVGPVAAEVEQAMRDQLGSGFADIAPYLAGGGAWFSGLEGVASSPWPDGWVDSVVTFAYATDEAGVQQSAYGYPILLEADTLDAAPGLVTGLYELQGTSLLTPASLLLP